MNITLVHLSKGTDGTPSSPLIDHLGLEIMARVLLYDGHEVTVIDSGILGLNGSGVLDVLCTSSPDIVGFALNYVNIRDMLWILENARHRMPKTHFVAGGHYATFHADQLLLGRVPFDAVVIGEGELPMSALAKTARPDWFCVPNLAILDSGKILRTRSAMPMEFNELPLAERSVLKNMDAFPRGCVKVAIEGSRGCTHTCTFCSIAACQALVGDPRRRRIREPYDVVDEVATILRDWGLKDFWFMDADFLGGKSDRQRIIEIADGLKELGHDISLEIDARADSVSRDTIRALRAAGLERVFLGVESFHQTTLNSFSKGATVEKNDRAIRLLEEEGVRPILGTIIFHPESSLDQLKQEHASLSVIGYEKTQMLFRLKMYKGSKDAKKDLDCEGRGVSPYEGYGWGFHDAQVQLVWDLFDRARLQLMDGVFITLTQQFHRRKINVDQFQRQSDKLFHGLGTCMEIALKAVSMKHDLNRSGNAKAAEKEIDAVITGLLKKVGE